MKKKIRIAALSLLVLVGWCDVNAQTVTLSPQNGAVGVCPDTRLRIIFNDIPAVGSAGMIRITDVATGMVVDSIDLSVPAGPTESRTYGKDCDYTKIPYDYARTVMPTNRDTRPGTPSGTAEPTPPEYQLNIIGGFTDAFHFHPVIIHDKTATICLHNNVLDYGRKYSVEISGGAIKARKYKGTTRKQPWTFTTKEAPKFLKDTLVVDASGCGDYCTVQGALDAVPDFCARRIVIFVKAGDYEEIVYARNKTNVKIKGEGMASTRVHYANNEVFNPHPLTVKTNEWPGTFPSRRAAFALDNCHDIILEDMTIATDLQGQAEGLLLNGERIALYRVHVIGSGDALQANGTVYMECCELDGGGDTILGRGSLFAYRSHFRNGGGPFSWVRNTAGHHGDVFLECTFSAPDGCKADFGRTSTNKGTSYPDAEFVLINCFTHNIIPEGWSSIGLPTARMLEYGTRDSHTRRLADTSQRHPYSRQLNAKTDAALIKCYSTPAFVLKGWHPAGSSVPPQTNCAAE